MQERIPPKCRLEDLKEKKLLVITAVYPNRDVSCIGGLFVKHQLDVIGKYFKEVVVIAPVLRTLGLLNNDRLCKDYAYDNVRVFFPRCNYVPILWLDKVVIDDRPRVVEKLIQKNHIGFDLIHAHFTWPSAYIGARLKSKCHTPVITTVHENGDWFREEVRKNHPMFRYAWENSDALIRVNKKDAPTLREYNKAVYSIPNGFPQAFRPMDTMEARKKLGLPPGKKVLFSLGYLIERKGFHHLIDAMGLVSSKRDDVVCYIGGTGPEKDRLKTTIARKSLDGHVKLVGFIPSDALPYWMNACDAFVLPSMNEGNPTVMFESIGCGKPFIGTNVGGIPEVIGSDRYGLLTEPGDPQGLARNILVALDRQWDRAAILDYSKLYTWEAIAQDILAIYCKALRNR
jgi:glycosyltransferase involved in cell wall biosynthesis